MAAINNATVIATVASNINAEYISRRVRRTVGRVPYTYQLAAKAVPLIGTNSNVYSHPLRSEIAAAGTITETDEVSSTQIARDDQTVSTATKYKATFISYKAARRSMWDEFNSAIDELVGACKRAIDNDFLAEAANLSNIIGNATTPHSVLNHVVIQTTWQAQTAATESVPLMFAHGDAMRDLANDAVSNGAALFGGAFGAQLADAANQVQQGMVKTFAGFNMVTTNNLPAGDTTGWSNMVVCTGDEDCAIAMPFEQEILVEIEHVPSRMGWWVIASVDYGMGVVNDDAGLCWITRT